MSEQRIPTAVSSSTVIGEKYKTTCPERGEVRVIEYLTHDYVPDIATSGNQITKTARVYLPYGYDTGKTYNVVFTMHGVCGSDQYDWLSEDSPSPATIIDNLIYYGDIEPCVMIFPNGRSTTDFNTLTDCDGYWYFGKELRNDLIPYIERIFSVGTARANRALCGLSMGGYQTSQIGMLENYDLFANYGVFSACFHHVNPFIYMSPEKIAAMINQSDLPLDYLFFCCGTADRIYQGLVPDLEIFEANVSPEKIQKGKNCSIVYIPDGLHNYAVWQVALYNYLQLIFKK